MVTDIEPLAQALRNKFQVTLTYTKKDGTTVVHTGGLYEIGANKAGNPCLYLWDTALNDHIRDFLIGGIQSFQVLNIQFFPPQSWPLKINGEIVG